MPSPDLPGEDGCSLKGDSVVPFDILDSVEAFADGLAGRLQSGAGDVRLVYEHVTDPLAWGSGPAPRLVLVAARDDSAWELLSRLGAVADGRQLTVVALLPDDSTISHRNALQRGATAAVWWREPPDLIRRVCVEALGGLSLIPAPHLQALASARLACEMEPPSELSDTERQWLRRLRDGDSARTVADDANYSERHFRRILLELYSRLGARGRIEAIAAATRYGLLDI